ncbi:MAG: polyprenyl synthetase family protein, partial [Leuconostoc lactis]
ESITQQLSLGKPIGQDIRNGIYTAPVLFALTDPTVRDDIRALLMQRDLINDADMIRLHELITQSHAMAKLNALLTDYTEQLQALIGNLPEPTIQTQLEQLSQLLLNRDH